MLNNNVKDLADYVFEKTSNFPFKWADRILRKLEDFNGDGFAKKFGGVPLERLIETWRQAIDGYTVDEIKRGLGKCETSRFTPNLGEFLEYCRPPLDFEAAFHEAAENIIKRPFGTDVWSHRAIYWAAGRLGYLEIKTNGYTALKTRWARILSDELLKTEWDEIPKIVPVPQLEEKKQSKVVTETAQKLFETYATKGRDMLQWARQPRSQCAVNGIVDAAKHSHEIKEILAELVEKGVVSPSMRLMKQWNGFDFVEVNKKA